MTSPKLTRTIELLKLLCFSPEPVPLKRAGEQLGLESSMLSRIVNDLIALGMVEKASYRTVTVSPELALLGQNAATVLPAAQCIRKIWEKVKMPPDISAAFASIVLGKLFFYFRNASAGAFSEPLEHSDIAAVIAAFTPDFSFDTIPEKDRSFFMERAAEAKEKSRLIREHAGRFRQVVLPVSWHGRPCAIGFLSKNPDIGIDKLFFCASRITTKLRSAGESEK